MQLQYLWLREVCPLNVRLTFPAITAGERDVETLHKPMPRLWRPPTFLTKAWMREEVWKERRVVKDAIVHARAQPPRARVQLSSHLFRAHRADRRDWRRGQASFHSRRPVHCSPHVCCSDVRVHANKSDCGEVRSVTASQTDVTIEIVRVQPSSTQLLDRLLASRV